MDTKNLLLLLLVLAGWPMAQAAPRHTPTAAVSSTHVAMVIGNDRYETAVGPLRNTGHDAKAMAKALRSLGFAVVEKHNVSRDELLAALLQFRSRLHGAEVGLFYFAGHGLSVAGANYLLPIKSGYDPAGASETDLRLLAETKLFNAEQAVAEMSHAGAGCNLVILDACRSTPVARRPQQRDTLAAGGLTEMNPPAGSLVAFATDSGHTAADGDGAQGLYTEELIKHLLTPGLSIEQVFKRTRAGVMARSGGAQIPAEYSRLVGEDIYLLPPVLKVLPAKPAAPSLAEVNRLAAAGDVAGCLEALRQLTRAEGANPHADVPLLALLEQVKESLRDPATAAAHAAQALETCDLVWRALADCLPIGHSQRDEFGAKSQNRRGDALLLLGRAEEALNAYAMAIPLGKR